MLALKRYRQWIVPTDPSVTLRLEACLHARLTTYAQYNARSLKEEIIARLANAIYDHQEALYLSEKSNASYKTAQLSAYPDKPQRRNQE